MKREYLENLDLGNGVKLTKEQIDGIMAENGKDIEATKSKFADYDGLKTQLGDANKTIEGFKAMDIDGIKKAADDWKKKAETAEADAAAKIAGMQFDGLLTGAVSAAKGKNAKAVRALLDVDTLKASKNQEADIKTALEALKKDNGYLFDTEPVPPLLAHPEPEEAPSEKRTPQKKSGRCVCLNTGLTGSSPADSPRTERID